MEHNVCNRKPPSEGRQQCDYSNCKQVFARSKRQVYQAMVQRAVNSEHAGATDQSRFNRYKDSSHTYAWHTECLPQMLVLLGDRVIMDAGHDRPTREHLLSIADVREFHCRSVDRLCELPTKTKDRSQSDKARCPTRPMITRDKQQR